MQAEAPQAKLRFAPSIATEIVAINTIGYSRVLRHDEKQKKGGIRQQIRIEKLTAVYGRCNCNHGECENVPSDLTELNGWILTAPSSI